MKSRASAIFIFLAWAIQGYTQKLPFQNFGIDRGLIQSQVLCITQDNQRHLWLGTFGGLDRFDGTSFTHLSKNEGLNSSAITCIYTAQSGTIWFGTFKGISSYDGFKITNYPVRDKSSSFNFTSIAEDETGNIWAFNFRKGLFVFKNNGFVKAPVPFVGAIPTCLINDAKKQLLANFYKKGVFLYKHSTWQKFTEIPQSDTTEFIVGINNVANDYFAFTNEKRLLKFSAGKPVLSKQIDATFFTASCLDNNGDIWVGTNKGVSVYNCNDLSVKATYAGAAGLSDNVINYIYNDAEGSMWVGTDGDGLFKFSGGAFAKFDKSNGLPGNIVMCVANNGSGNIFIATREGGLVKYNAAGKTITNVDYSMLDKGGINAMAADANNHLFLGMVDNKLLKYNGAKFQEVFLEKRVAPFINSIVSEGDKTWFTTSAGCYYLKNDSATKIIGIDDIAIGALPIGKGEVLVGSTNGIYRVSKDNTAKKIQVPALQDVEVRCFSRFHHFALIGTADEGIFFWNLQTGAVYKCNSANGLFDNQVFSIFVDKKDNIWAGTGTGIQKIFFDEKKLSFSVKKFSKADGYENSENNLNAITEDDGGAIWIGTTKGAFIFKQDTAFKKNIAPLIVIQNAESPAFIARSPAIKNVSRWYHFPVSQVLPYSKNNISFTVKGIFLKDPESIRYSYQLVGYDTGFSKPVTQTFFNYQSLEPGSYVFRIKAVTENGVVSGNIAEYSFAVATPFYKATWFLVLTTCALILTGVLIQLLFNRAKLRKKKQLEMLREEEQQKIRQRTSEDFHDELGNKLTRISLLTDILQKKVGEADDEKNNIIKQMKENVQALYAGTKDVIWSLSPGSDNFLEILNRINQFGEDLFHDSEISFSFFGLETIDPKLKLPIDYSRNIIMIFKELLNNSLRHSHASKINMSIKNDGDNQFVISESDNGTGFEHINIEKGNGLNNIQRRSERIVGVIEMVSHLGEGTNVALKIKIPLNGG